MTRKNIVILSLIATAILIVIAIVYFTYPISYIKFSTAPQQVIVAVDGKKYTINNSNTITVSPGSHTISVSQNEFSTYIKEITTKNRQTSEFLVALSPLTDAAKNKLTDSNSQSIIQRFYGNVYLKQTDELTKKYPILNILPIQARLYIVSACPSKKYPNDNTKLALCVTETQSELQPYVLKDIQAHGYDPSNYEIIWTVSTT